MTAHRLQTLSSGSATLSVLQAVTGLTGTKPNVPSLIVTVNQVG